MEVFCVVIKKPGKINISVLFHKKTQKEKYMIKRILLIGVFILLSVQIGFAQGRGLGLGLMIGEPTGISVKGWVTNSGAIDLGIGYPSLSNTQGTVLVQIIYGIHTSFGHVNIFHYFMESAEFSESVAVLTLWERVAFWE